MKSEGGIGADGGVGAGVGSGGDGGAGSGGEVCSDRVGSGGDVTSGGGARLVVGVDVPLLRDLPTRTIMIAMAATARQKRMIGVMLIGRFLEDGVAVSRDVAVAAGSSEVVNMGVAVGVGVGVADRDADTDGIHPAETWTVLV